MQISLKTAVHASHCKTSKSQANFLARVHRNRCESHRPFTVTVVTRCFPQNCVLLPFWEGPPLVAHPYARDLLPLASLYGGRGQYYHDIASILMTSQCDVRPSPTLSEHSVESNSVPTSALAPFHPTMMTISCPSGTQTDVKVAVLTYTNTH